jgi:hypothetical protein
MSAPTPVRGNPVVLIEELRRFPLKRRRVPGPGIVQVYSGRAGRLSCPPGGLSTGELLWLGPRLVYDIDVSRHDVRHRFEAQSADGSLVADVEVHAAWRTVAPVVVVASNVSDGPSLVEAALEALLQHTAAAPWRTAAELTGHLAEAPTVVELPQGIGVEEIRWVVLSILATEAAAPGGDPETESVSLAGADA